MRETRCEHRRPKAPEQFSQTLGGMMPSVHSPSFTASTPALLVLEISEDRQDFTTVRLRPLARFPLHKPKLSTLRRKSLLVRSHTLMTLLHFFGIQRRTLIHGDYKIDNLVYHKTEPRVIGILEYVLSLTPLLVSLMSSAILIDSFHQLGDVYHRSPALGSFKSSHPLHVCRGSS